ncbi:MAG: TonB-dependent receptor [Methylotenera sp.]|nr:TonB-dependent receptor [Methylotenera sp.]
MKKTIIASLVSLAFTTSAYAEETVITTNDVTVKANRFEHKDTETTYASEIHTAKEIEESGAATLYDFLAQHSSVNLLSNFGNKATPSINLRGYGAENGYQNVVITVDGQRLNNIDMQPQLIGAIPLSNIERIEISKGSGSVLYGDGATAGSIQIYTKNKTGITASSSFGNYGQQNHYLTAGISEKYIDLSASLAHDGYDGASKKDETGHRDEFSSDTQSVKLKIKPNDNLRFLLEGTSSRNDIRYVNALTKAEFNDDPKQVTKRLFSQTYTHQGFDTDQWRAGIEFDINSQFKVSATHFREDKRSEFVNFFSESNYDYDSNEIALTYVGNELNVIGGVQAFEGDRTSTANKTTKDNKAIFIQTEYRPTWISDSLTLSAGARNEAVKYHYTPTIGTDLADSEHLDAWDIGANYRFTETFTMFANYNQAFQAPDVDRFFTFFGTFNAFIEPETSRTLNIGLNHITANNRLKVTLFHANLSKEIYFNPFTFTNTNIDDSHKYGLELQDSFTFSKQLSTSFIYNYTRSIIDREKDFGSAINGNDLPGVPKHTVVANMNYKFLDHANFNLNHTWRARAYAYNDFQNNAAQRQAHYESTNAALSYQFKNYQVFTSITNLFEHENSIQVADDAIYPVDFVRTWRVGVKADF